MPPQPVPTILLRPGMTLVASSPAAVDGTVFVHFQGDRPRSGRFAPPQPDGTVDLTPPDFCWRRGVLRVAHIGDSLHFVRGQASLHKECQQDVTATLVQLLMADDASYNVARANWVNVSDGNPDTIPPPENHGRRVTFDGLGVRNPSKATGHQP